MPQRVRRPGSRNRKDEAGQRCLGVVSTLLIFLLVGGGLCFWGWRIVRDARASASWPQSRGVVTKSEVTQSSDSDGADSYSPRVTYTYPAGDRYHESYTIKFGENSYDSRRRAEEVATRYRAGTEVTVYYDPARPGKSVLEPGVSGGSFIVLSVGAIFVLVGLVVAPLAYFLSNRGARAT